MWYCIETRNYDIINAGKVRLGIVPVENTMAQTVYIEAECTKTVYFGQPYINFKVECPMSKGSYDLNLKDYVILYCEEM